MSNGAAMFVPKPPPIPKLDRISPTVYEAALRCVARAAWLGSGDRKLLAPHPRASLGIGVHAVLEQARRAGIPGDSEEQRRDAAAKLFDEKMAAVFVQTHPLLRAKFEVQDRIPFYNLYRARAAQIASEMASVPRTRTRAVPAHAEGLTTHVEATLVSKDGRIAGRPDVIEAEAATVVDYKTGSPADSQRLTDNELRQLRLYAFLAAESGIPIRTGVIERANRERVEVQISQKEAADEGGRALKVLDEYNRHAGGAFSDAASPSPEACRHCPCIPLCEAFWNASEPGWEAECGTQVEGTVESVDGDSLMSIHLNVVRGTGARGPAVITRLSREWLTLNEMDVPRPGEMVRVTDAAHVAETTSPAVFRADRVTTAVWRVEPTGPADE
jgi:PD-(D/E)XK nuclease superfamily